MRTIIIFHLILIFHLLCYSTVINLQGYIPKGINAFDLQKEYKQIRAVLQPSFKDDQKAITILFYSHHDERKLGVRLPEWGGGGALGEDSIIIPIDKLYAFYPEDLKRITLHELVHIALARAYHSIRIPRWFHEGVAMSLSGELSFDESVLLSRALVLGTLVPFDSIEYVNRFNQYKAQLAYCESHFAVQYLNKLYGIDMLSELLDSASHQRRFDSACVKVFGLTVNEFEQIVKTEIRNKYHYVFLFSDYAFLWILIVILFLVGFILTMIRNHKRRRKLEIEEMENDAIEENSDEHAPENSG